MGLRGEIIVDYERILVKEISKRFKKLRGKTLQQNQLKKAKK